MSIFQAIILGLIQGFTEFIPVSSSGHLVLAEKILNLDTSNLTAFDVILHGGTLVSLLIFFFPKFKKQSNIYLQKNLILNISLAALPILVIAGIITLINILSGNFVDNLFKNNWSIVFSLSTIGLLFILADFFIKDTQKYNSLHLITKSQGIKIGMLQPLSIIRGASRSGVTILAAISQGISRKTAAEFSFLVGIPVIGTAFVVELMKIVINGNLNLDPSILIAGFISAAISGIIAINFTIFSIEKIGLKYFGIYRILVAVAVIIFII